MTVSSVVNGLMQMTQDIGTRSVASVLLAGARMQNNEVSTWVQPKGPLRDLAATLDHYAREDDDQEARALLQFAAGEKRDIRVIWQLGTDPRHGRDVERLVRRPGNAKALLRIVAAVDQAQPNLVSVKAGQFVRSIGDRGEVKWAQVDKDFQLADAPVSSLQFLPLSQLIGLPAPSARGKNTAAKDPILNVAQSLRDDWIRILNFLTGTNYRIPKEKEWERGTAKNLRVVDLASEARDRNTAPEELVQKDWHRRYANAFLGDASSPFGLGALIFNEPERVLTYLRDGLSVSAWDFNASAFDTKRWENVYESVSLGKDKPEMTRHIGYRHFVHRDRMKEDPNTLQDPMNNAFRLAKFGLPPSGVPSSRRGRP